MPRPLDESDILGALPLAVLVVDGDDGLCFANGAAESLFGMGAGVLCRKSVQELFGDDGIAFSLLARVRSDQGSLVARDVAMDGLPGGLHADIWAAPVADRPGFVTLVLEVRRLPDMVKHQGLIKGAAQSVFGLAAMLAHEIRNPLSGIRGAAQLLERKASADGKAMTGLIRQEVDRIGGLVDQLEKFTDVRPFQPVPVNIHTILGHARDVAQSGFARSVRFVEQYDPSLPPVSGDRDRLVQIVLNLVKNAAEAVADEGGEIYLGTAWRHGLRLPMPDGSYVDLPIEVSIRDNGPGIADHLKDHVFEPFVTGREGGTGLGLAMVAKLVAEHGGLIELESDGSGTKVLILLPAAFEGESDV